MAKRGDQFAIRNPEYLERFRPFHNPTSFEQIAAAVQKGLDINKAAARCLDSMAGTGMVGHYLKKIFKNIHVVFQDKSEKMLASAAYSAEDERVLSDAAALPFADQSFDIVTCRVGLNNVSEKDYPKILSEYLRVLSDKGIVVLQDHFADTPEAKTTINQLEKMIAEIEGRNDETYVPTIKELEQMIVQAGGKITKEDRFNIDFSLLDRLHSKRVVKPNISAIQNLLQSQKSVACKIAKDDIIITYRISTIVFKK